MQSAKKRITVGRALLILLCALLVLVLLALAAVFALLGNEIMTLASFTQLRPRDDAHLDGSVYQMEVKGGYYLDEFVAQGGVSNDQELIAFVTENITKGLIDVSIAAPEVACSSFTATAADGDALFGRNYDMKKTNTCIVLTNPGGGRHASVSTVDLQFLGMDVDSDVTALMDRITCLAAPYAPLDGINDAGVACGIYMTYQGGEETVPTDQQTDKPDFTSTTLLRLILDYADSVDEAVEIARSYDMHDSAKTSYHYMVADATGASAVLEWVGATDATDNDGSARELRVTYNDDDAHIGETEAAASWQVVTNFILQPGYYDGSPETDKKGADRYDRLYQELNARGGIVADENEAMSLLAIVGRRTWKNDDNNGCTVHSAVYNLTERTATWVPNEHYDESPFVYDLKK